MSIRHVGLVEKWDTNLLHRIRQFVDFAANSAQMDKVSITIDLTIQNYLRAERVKSVTIL